MIMQLLKSKRLLSGENPNILLYKKRSKRKKICITNSLIKRHVRRRCVSRPAFPWSYSHGH